MSITYGIIGLRHDEGLEFNNYEYLKLILNLHRPNMAEMVSGGARGAETLAERWARSTDVPFRKVIPQVKMFQEHLPSNAKTIEAAFITRNMEIISLSDALVIFWNGVEHMNMAVIVASAKLSKPIHVYPLSP